jgi:molybdopterin synthase catalytic subunit
MNSTSGAVITFSGIVRDREGNQTITSLFYEAYRPMAETLIRKIALEIAASHPCTSVEVLHLSVMSKLGKLPFGSV